MIGIKNFTDMCEGMQKEHFRKEEIKNKIFDLKESVVIEIWKTKILL